ncbi:MAG: radical SAM protein, partial [Smithellaceae bacterium]|nr:radical SAM protein [Smithellaceae bacterium]
MKVAIIAPPYPLEEAPAPPLGVTYVAAACEAAGARVQIFDYIVTKYSEEKLRAQLDEFNPEAAGVTSVTLNFLGAAEIISTVKRLRPGIVTMMGGPHVSFTAAEVLDAYPGIDIIVIGEGEATLQELLPVINERDKWEGVKGIAFRRDGRTMITPPRELIANLDSIPLPARHLLPLSRYQALGYPISIITGRGCPYRCIFCVGQRMVGNKVRLRSPARVVDEIEQILSYGITRINVADDLFASKKARVLDVCTEIGRRGLRFDWSAFARVNTVDRETLEAMREAGCDAVSFGVESGNQEMLDRIGKAITKDMVCLAVNLCKETGIIPHTSFIVGLPGETRETLAETKAFAKGLGSLFGYHFLAPFPGTRVRDRVADYDLEILTDDWNRYDANSAIVRTRALSPEEMNAFVADYDKEIETAWEDMVAGY